VTENKRFAHTHTVAGVAILATGALLHLLAWSKLTAGNLEWSTWFYQAAWGSYILIVGGVTLLIAGSSLTGDRFRFLIMMLPWSVLWWTIFDIYGLRLRNWYYVMAPPDTPVRWFGYWTAFSTVIPLSLVTFDLLRRTGLAGALRCRPFRVTTRIRRLLVFCGIISFLLPLAFPDWFFPLTWLFAPLLLEPWLDKRGTRSLLRDLSEGQPANLIRLMVAGFIVGGAWEFFNGSALAKWIYTIPGFEDGKLFEMPVLGFFGFPPFMIGTYSFWNAVSSALHLPDWQIGDRAIQRFGLKLAVSVLVTVPLSILGFYLIDSGTVKSFRPVRADVPGCAAGIEIRRQRRAPSLVEDNGDTITIPGEESDRCRSLLAMAYHRGLGLPRALQLEAMGITDLQNLANQDCESLLASWPEDSNPPRPEEVTIWIRAASNHGSAPSR